jgi:radical SAM protein with 4Fe4S-binding SPASM domain
MNTRTINLSGGGEPTLHPQFGKILQAVANMGFRSWLVTHGGLMHKWMDDLLLADHIRISLDASTAAEHKEMHGSHGLEYERVLHNITDLCKRRVNGSPEVGLGYIISDANGSGASIQRVLEFASSVGVDFVQFRPLSEDKPVRFTGDWLAIAQEIERMAPAVSVDVWPIGKRWKDVFQQREFQTCYSAFTNAVISADGSVCACCDRRDIVFGNVNEQSFKSIWLSAQHRVKADAIEPKLCNRCLQCSFNRSVEKYIVNNEALPELL